MKRLMAAMVVVSGVACGGEPEVAGTVAELKNLLAQYDRAGGGNTIPIEQALIRLRDARATKELEPFLAHKRFGFEAAWALSEIGDAASAPALLAEFKSRDANGRLEFAPYVGAFRTDDVRAALRAAVEAASGPERDACRAALLRAGDPALEKETLAKLQDKDPAACAQALLLVGDSRREDLLDRLAALAKDERAVPGDLKTRFGVQTTTKTPDGWTRTNTDYPVLKTVGAVALEAASRAASPATPEITAWWYEIELPPRFASTTSGAALLAAYVEAGKAAAKAKAGTARDAIAALARVLRGSGEDVKARILGVAFTDHWEIRYRPGMDGDAGPEKTATVDRDGKVALK